MPSIRRQLVSALRPALPTRWRFVADESTIDRLTVPALLLSQRVIRRTPAAPIGAHTVEFLLTVIDPTADLAKAETELDDELDTVLHILDATLGLVWKDATKKVWKERHLAYDVTLEVTSRKE